MDKILIRVLLKILPIVSESIKDYFPDFLNDLEAKAAATSNPIDDVFVMILKGLIKRWTLRS